MHCFSEKGYKNKRHTVCTNDLLRMHGLVFVEKNLPCCQNSPPSPFFYLRGKCKLFTNTGWQVANLSFLVKSCQWHLVRRKALQFKMLQENTKTLLSGWRYDLFWHVRNVPKNIFLEIVKYVFLYKCVCVCVICYFKDVDLFMYISYLAIDEYVVDMVFKGLRLRCMSSTHTWKWFCSMFARKHSPNNNIYNKLLQNVY